MRRVERGNIVALQMRRKPQEFRTVEFFVRFFVFDVQLNRFGKRFLALADVEDVEKVGNRFGIVGARAAADDNRLIRAVGGKKRNAGKLQHV